MQLSRDDMSHQFPEYYFSVSERLSYILENSGYSREDRNRKVTVANDIEVFINIAESLNGNSRNYIFGSRGEGSTGPCLESDTDILHHDDQIKVVTEISQCDPEMFNFLMVKDNHIHSGYVKLQQIRISPDYTPVPVYLESGVTEFYAIDSLDRTVLTNTIHHNFDNISVSGPAYHQNDYQKELSTDSVYALEYSQWPQEGYEWFMRRRLNGWPTLIQIENARKHGCFVTPVGHPHSFERLVEWRLSFSVAERDLIRSFEDATMKVYIMLKMIRKTYIEPCIGDAFSSYHCKVCMLWMRERIPHNLWCKENLLQCLILCIRQLYEWAIAGFCPDYFIITNNIYDRKIIGAIRNTLVQILVDLLSSNCTFLLGIQCCNLGNHISDQSSIFGCCILSTMNEEKVNHMLVLRGVCDCRNSILELIPQHYSALVDYLDILMYASKCFKEIMKYPLRHAMMIIFSQLGFHIATICKENAHILSPEQVNYLISLALGCLSFGINIDATSVRLKLCGLSIELGNPHLVQTSLRHISDNHMRYTYSCTTNIVVIPLKCNTQSSMEKLLRKKYNIEELLQTQTSFSVIYLPTEMSITPKPLRMEMFRSIGAPSELREKHVDAWFDWGVVDSIVCLYFFQYLNFRRQGKERYKEAAMYNMIHAIRTEPGITHIDTAFNLLGYSFIREHQLINAFRCFVLSLSIRPYHNSAKFYLAIIFNRIHAEIRHTHHVNSISDIFS